MLERARKSQGTKCEEWKDEKKSSATVLYTQNYKLAACVHCTRYTLCRRISSSIDRSVSFYGKSSNNGNREIVWKIAECCMKMHCVVHNV